MVNVEEIEKYTEDDLYEYIEECYPDVKICGYNMSQARILEEVDPIAYSCLCDELQEYEYQCGECGEVYDDEDEAEECCGEEE